MKAGKSMLSERICGMRRNIQKDNDLFIRFGFDPSLIDFADDDLPLFAFKILFAYALSVIKREDRDKYDSLQKNLEGYGVGALRIDKNLDDALMEFLSDIATYNIQILEALSLFGWKVMQFENGMIREEGINLSQFAPKDVKDFLGPYFETVYLDSIENDGAMDLFVLENKRIGKYYSFMKAYPERKIPELHQAIEDAEIFLYVPMYYWEGDLHGELISQEGVFYTTFAAGYCGGMCRYSEAYLISPGCLSMACYMNRLLQMAEEEIPDFREFVNN